MEDNVFWGKQIREILDKNIQTAYEAGGEKKIRGHHEKGKLTARERIQELFDTSSFHELNLLTLSRHNNLMVDKKHYYGDGVIAGYGKVNGRIVFAVAQDATISGGAGGEEQIKKICHCLQMAIKVKAPFVSLNESGGAKIEEGIDSLAAYSELFYLNTEASGYIPQIAAIMGNCAGGSSYSPAMHDFVFMTKQSQMYITGPKVVYALTGEKVTMEELGGYRIHCEENGQVHFLCDDDRECIKMIRRFLEYLPSNNKEAVHRIEYENIDLSSVIEQEVPSNKRVAYDVKKVINAFVDKNSFFEVSAHFAANICIGFARIEGQTIGIVANQPLVFGGALDCDASDKGARFVRFCDCFNIPLIVLVDVPGFKPGKDEEKKGILRHGSKLLYSFAEATVPKITLIMRKAYGGAYCAMNGKNLGADIVYAWPICEVAVMGAEGAVDIICKDKIQQSEDAKQTRKCLIDQYNELYLTPYYAASRSLVDEIIKPEETRKKLLSALQMLSEKEKVKLDKKHGNISL